MAVDPIELTWFRAPLVVDLIELASFAVVDGPLSTRRCGLAANGFIEASGNPADEHPVARIVEPAKTAPSIARRALAEGFTVLSPKTSTSS